MLNEVNHLPDGLLTAKAEDLHQFLEAPTLIHLEGINPQPLFICTLLHGNETTGLYALQRLLKEYSDNVSTINIYREYLGSKKQATTLR